MYKKTGVAALVAAVSITTLAGCTASTTTGSTGSGGSTSTGNTSTGALTPANALLAAMSKASGDNSVTITGTVTGGSSGTSTKLSGVEEFQPLKSDITMNITGGSTGAMTIAAIYDGTNYYMQDAQLSALEGGKPWLELNTSSLGSGLGASLGTMLNSAKTESPSEELGPLLASGDLTDVGTGTVNGVQATHYSGTMTASQAADLASVNGLDSSDVQEIKSLFQTGGVQSEKMDVWVNSSNLPVQVTVATTSTALGTVTSVTNFTNWGAPVTITDPPADQVGTFSIPNIPTSIPTSLPTS